MSSPMPSPYIVPTTAQFQPPSSSSAVYPPPAESTSTQPSSPGAYSYDHTTRFRIVKHRFAGCLFQIRTDAARRSKQLKVKRVGDAVEYYCSGVLLTKIKYKLQGDIFYLYADFNVDRRVSPFEDRELCSKIEVLMGCIVADIFQKPWNKRSFNVAWGVSDCHDLGDGNSLYVSVSKDVGSRRSEKHVNPYPAGSTASDGTSASPYQLERGSSEPVVSKLDAFHRGNSHERSIGGQSWYAVPPSQLYERSDILAVLRDVELITAMQLGKRSFLVNEEVAGVIGSRCRFPYSDYRYGKFDATVPTLFGLLVRKFQDRSRRRSWSNHDYDSSSGRSSESESTAKVPNNLEAKPLENSDTAAPPPIPAIVGGSTNSTVANYGYNLSQDGIEFQLEIGDSEDESQPSGDDPFAEQNTDATDSDSDSSFGEQVPLRLPDDGPSRGSSKYPDPNYFPNPPPQLDKSHPGDSMNDSNKAAPVRPPLPPYKHESSTSDGPTDNVASPSREGASPSTDAIVSHPLHRNVQTPVVKSTHIDFTQTSEQTTSVESADGKQVLALPITRGGDEGDNGDEMSSDEGQTRCPSPKDSPDGLIFRTEEDNYGNSTCSADEQHNVEDGKVLIVPSRGNAVQGENNDFSGNEDEAKGQETGDKTPLLKSILRSEGEGSRRKGGSNQVQFSIPPPEHKSIPFQSFATIPEPQGNSRESDMGNTSAINLSSSYTSSSSTSPSSLVSSDESLLPTPAIYRKKSRRYSRLRGRSSRLGRKSSNESHDSTGFREGRNNAPLQVAKDLFTLILGSIIVILSILAIAFDPAEEENWFKQIEQGMFVMFSLGVPFILAMRSRLSDNLEILLPRTTRDVRSLRDLQSMNKGMPYNDFVKKLQKALLYDEQLSNLFSFKNASYKLGREDGKLVLPEQAAYTKSFKMVWFFGEELAFNKILGKAYRYRHENGVLYIEKDAVGIDGVIVHVRRRVGNYVLGSSPEN